VDDDRLVDVVAHRSGRKLARSSSLPPGHRTRRSSLL
jgi:hypothetical protein